MFNLSQPILRTDISGMPLEWIGIKRAINLIALDQVAYTCGEFALQVRGGVNRITLTQSRLEVNSIISTYGHCKKFDQLEQKYSPPLHNLPLFQRDDWLCMYCGDSFDYTWLSRDHVTPIMQDGSDTWNNVVTACVRCNNFKAGRTPEQAGMTLIAIPFVPTHAEYVYLQGRNVLADQREFLKSHFPRSSRLRSR